MLVLPRARNCSNGNNKLLNVPLHMLIAAHHTTHAADPENTHPHATGKAHSRSLEQQTALFEAMGPEDENQQLEGAPKAPQ